MAENPAKKRKISETVATGSSADYVVHRYGIHLDLVDGSHTLIIDRDSDSQYTRESPGAIYTVNLTGYMLSVGPFMVSVVQHSVDIAVNNRRNLAFRFNDDENMVAVEMYIYDIGAMLMQRGRVVSVYRSYGPTWKLVCTSGSLNMTVSTRLVAGGVCEHLTVKFNDINTMVKII